MAVRMLEFFVFYAFLDLFDQQLDNHIGWATLMPFPSILIDIRFHKYFGPIVICLRIDLSQEKETNDRCTRSF